MTITRRRMMTTGAGAGAALSLGINGASAQGTRTRYSATSAQGKQMLIKYAKAVGMMMDNSKFPRSDPRSWDFQWYTHWIPGPQSPWSAVATAKTNMINQVFAGKPPNDPNRLLAQAMWDDCQAHASNPNDPNFFQEMFFCVWHRFYVYYFEEIIRAVLPDTTFTLPYWDYLSGQVADLSIPPEFLVTNSPLYRNNRNPWVNNGERIDKNNPGSMNLNAFNEPIYIDSPDGDTGFCPVLDGNPHGLVHVYTGGQMNMGRIPFAAGDPVFWLHHCNIDRLWESWNRLPGRNNPPWPNRPFPFADGSGKGVKVLPAGANRVAQLKYQYDKYYTPKKVVPLPGPALMAAAAVSRVTKLAATEPVALADRARVALSPPASQLDIAPTAARTLAAASSPSRRIYLVLGNITVNEPTDATYNVFLDLPEGANPTGANDPRYAGTLQFFGAAGHEQHRAAGHRTVFNVTDTVKALQAKGQLATDPSVTLIRQGGDVGGARPTVGQIYLMES
jgi:tyrosinase